MTRRVAVNTHLVLQSGGAVSGTKTCYTPEGSQHASDWLESPPFDWLLRVDIFGAHALLKLADFIDQSKSNKVYSYLRLICITISPFPARPKYPTLATKERLNTPVLRADVTLLTKMTNAQTN